MSEHYPTPHAGAETCAVCLQRQLLEANRQTEIWRRAHSLAMRSLGKALRELRTLRAGTHERQLQGEMR